MSGVRKSRRDPRNDFLQKSANLLRKNAPSTSAFISAERIGLLYEQDTLVSDYQKSQVCAACGCLRENPEDGQNPSGSAHKDEDAYTCDRCNRKTRLHHRDINLPAKGQMVEQATVVSAPGGHAAGAAQLQGEQSEKPEASSVTNTPSSSHKRAKARKQNSLQALLAKSKKTQETQNSGLDFMDFMKAA